MTLIWRAVAAPMPAAGVNVAATVAPGAGGSLHVFADATDGQGVSHLTISWDGATRRLPDLPLGSVSGAATGVAEVIVAGARIDDGVPAACLVSPRSGTARLMELSGPSRPLAAWPTPVGGDQSAVIWAVGGAGVDHEAPALVYARLGEERVTVDVMELPASDVWGLQACADADGGVDVLVSGPTGVSLVGLGPNARTPAPPAWLSGDTVLARGRQGRGVLVRPDRAADNWAVDVWEIGLGTNHRIALPAPPEGITARVVRPILVPCVHLLGWTTESPDAANDSHGEPTVRTVTARGWTAPLVGWQVTEQPIEAPVPHGILVEPAGPRAGSAVALVARGPGPIRVWLGQL